VVAVSFTALSTVFGTLIGAASPGERWLPILP
jgi:hypothetical protein